MLQGTIVFVTRNYTEATTRNYMEAATKNYMGPPREATWRLFVTNSTVVNRVGREELLSLIHI